MTQSQADRFPVAVIAVACVLSAAGCNPASTSADTSTSPVLEGALVMVESTLVAPEEGPPVAVPPPSPLTTTPTPAAKAETQTAPAAASGPAAPRETRPSTVQSVVIAGLPPGPGREVVQRVSEIFTERRTPKVAAVALANKNARMIWAIMTSGERYREPLAA